MMAAQLIITCASNRVSLLPSEPPTQAYADLSSDLTDNSTTAIAPQDPLEDTQAFFSQLDPQQWLMPELFPWDQWSSLLEEPMV